MASDDARLLKSRVVDNKIIGRHENARKNQQWNDDDDARILFMLFEQKTDKMHMLPSNTCHATCVSAYAAVCVFNFVHKRYIEGDADECDSNENPMIGSTESIRRCVTSKIIPISEFRRWDWVDNLESQSTPRYVDGFRWSWVVQIKRLAIVDEQVTHAKCSPHPTHTLPASRRPFFMRIFNFGKNV